MPAPKILIVDSETAIAGDLATTLAGFGYDVVGIASSGPEAIALTAQSKPDLVVVDLEASGDMDGVAAADGIRQHWPIPVIFLTTPSDDAGSGGARDTEPFTRLVKPFTEPELRISIEMALYKDKTKQQTHELEDRFFAISIDMLCFLDFNGYFKRLNPAWEKTLGFTREELQSRPSIDFVHPDDRERTLKQNSKVRAGGQALSFENRYLCKDGSFKWLLWNAAPDVGHRVIYSVARDITERKRAETEREALVRDLQAALAEVRALQTILPICSYCRKIRDDENYWQTVENYISHRTIFSHSICPTCYKNEVEPQLDEMNDE